MLSSYWPTNKNIEDCIKLEAEELSDQVLLSVHEPMTILRKKEGNSSHESPLSFGEAEQAVLKNLKNSNRPVPIIGPPGSGKSHLIRWLDIQLQNDPATQDWLVRRIPKSASLKEVLLRLLEGLDGEIFAGAREKVNQVGRKLSTGEVAEHLIVNINSELNKLYESLNEKKKSLRNVEPSIAAKEIESLKVVKKHGAKECLPSLLGDSFYKRTLLDPDKGCIYQIAKRLTQGSSIDDIEGDNYYLQASDLDFNGLGDKFNELSLYAREYVAQKQLNTNLAAREEAVGLVNSIIGDACGNIYQQFYQLHGGTFLDLFLEIRKNLKGKTLVILIEDMSLITAIESDLITSLTREETRDGVKELCDLKSAIAVTSDYSGYMKHRNSLVSRNAGIEWEILLESENDHSFYQRLEDFCGRYLNAARYGSDRLEDIGGGKKVIYKSSDQDELKLEEAFGYSPSGFSLFPYNKQAIRAFSEKVCRTTTGDLILNPRKVLREVLIENLSLYRGFYLKGNFPPPNFSNINCSSSLERDLRGKIHKDLERVKSIAAIWGFGAKNIEELASYVSASLSRAFNLDELGELLENTKPVKPQRNTTPAIEKIKQSKAVTPEIKKPNVDQEDSIYDLVDKWFEEKYIPQNYANILRQFLKGVILKRWSNYSNWLSINLSVSELEKKLGYGPTSVPVIQIPYNSKEANEVHEFLSLILGGKKLTKTIESDIKAVIIAILNLSERNSLLDANFEDYCIVENYLSKWLPYAFETLHTKLKEGLKDNGLKNALQIHYSLALSLFPSIQGYSIKDKINFLCSKKADIDGVVHIADIALADTGIQDWDNFKNSQINNWNTFQSNWFKFVSINTHAIDGVVVQQAARGLSIELDVSVSHLVKNSCEQVKSEYPLFQKLRGMTTKDDFIDTLERLSEVLKKMDKDGQYQRMDNYLTARQIKKRVQKTSDNEGWESVKSVIGIFDEFSLVSAISCLQKINIDNLSDVSDVLKAFYAAIEFNLPRIKQDNDASGANAKEASKTGLGSRIVAIQSCCHDLIGQGEKV